MTFNDTPTKSSSICKTSEKPHRSSFGEVITQVCRVTGSTIVILGFGATIAEYTSYNTTKRRI